MERLFASHMTQIVADLQGIYSAMWKFDEALWHGKLTPPLREMLRLRSAQIMGCQY